MVHMLVRHDHYVKLLVGLTGYIIDDLELPGPGSRTCCSETLERTDPSGFRTAEPPDEADGVTTAWIEFETAVGRGRGLLRLKDDGRLDAAHHALRAQGPRGAEGHRATPRVPSTARTGSRETGRRSASARPASSATGPALRARRRRRPGRHRAVARLRPARRPTIVVDKRGRPGDQWRGARTSRCPIQ